MVSSLGLCKVLHCIERCFHLGFVGFLLSEVESLKHVNKVGFALLRELLRKGQLSFICVFHLRALVRIFLLW